MPPARSQLHGWTPARARGVRRQPAAQHARAVGPGVGKALLLDGRAESLEAQVRGPIEAADELGGDWPAILRRLGEDAALAARFRVAFPGGPGVSEMTIIEALASYVRSLVSPPSRFDAWIDGDRSRHARPRCAASACSSARPAACSATSAGASPTTASTTSVCRAATPAAAGWPGGDARQHGLQDSRPARACRHRALYARRVAADAPRRASRTTPARSSGGRR